LTGAPWGIMVGLRTGERTGVDIGGLLRPVTKDQKRRKAFHRKDKTMLLLKREREKEKDRNALFGYHYLNDAL
jgi:hypothetical protein